MPVSMAQNDYECFGYIDDSRLQFGCQSCSVVLVVRCKLIQKCPIFCSFADTEFRSDKIRKCYSLVRGYLTNLMVLESSSVMCCVACEK